MSRIRPFYLLITWLTMFPILCLAQSEDATVEINQSHEIDKLVSLRKEMNRTEGFFKIQVYNGTRTGAMEARKEFRTYFPSIPVSMEYETPNYKIWVGQYQNRLEADRALLDIRKTFKSAFIFRPKVETPKPLKEN